MALRQQLTGLLLVLFTLPAGARDLPLNLIKLPDGFHIEVYAGNVPNARSMSMSPSGTLFVGSRDAGKVYAIKDSNRDGRGDKVYVIAEGLSMPNGVAFRDGALYVAEVNRILRFDDIEYQLQRPPQAVVVSTDFPDDKHHGWKFIRIGPDNKLYVPIGAPCNVCIEYGYAVITRLNLDGSVHEIYAEGIRNTVGFDWHPDSKELWFTDNGRDMLGDDVPSDELNRAPRKGLHFGFPYCHGGEVLDPEFGLGHGCNEYTPPVQKLGAHVASLGMRFYIGKQFPVQYHKQVFIAEHGSWNRTNKTGYRISLVRLKGNKAVSYESFAEGWLQGQEAWGRPVDIEHMADGSLLVSDDKAGAIYRIYFDGKMTPRSLVKENIPTKLVPPPERKLSIPPVMQKTIVDKKQESSQAPATATDAQDVQQGAEIKTAPVTIKPLRKESFRASEDIYKNEEQKKAQQNNTQLIKIQVEQDVSNKNEQVQENNKMPPAELIEKIRSRAEQNVQPSPDPFSPVKKQTVNQ